jgi:predicted methyltransferase
VNRTSLSATTSYPADLAVGLAREIVRSRPPADTRLDQYLMTHASLCDQLRATLSFFEARKVLVLGDDDHLSVLIARFSSASVTVVEIDPRICTSLEAWASRLGLPNLTVQRQDIRNLPEGPTHDIFYMNPPFGSKVGGHPIRAWVTAGRKALIPGGAGILVMPCEGSDSRWIDEVWVSTQAFTAQNGLRLDGVGPIRHIYENTSDPALESTNWYLQFRCPGLRRDEMGRPGERLYR